MYKLEDMELIKEAYTENNELKFRREGTSNRCEKIQLINEATYNLMIYIIKLLSKWNADKDTLKKDKYGRINTNSKKAWVNKNDTLKVVRMYNNIGEITISGVDILLEQELTEDVYNEIYHNTLLLLYYKEREYYKKHNPFYQKLYKVREFTNQYGYLNKACLMEIRYTNPHYEEVLNEAELNDVLEVYEKIDEYVKNITKEKLANII